MAMPVGRTQVLTIYKQLLKESHKFAVYNFKMYAIRRIRDAFKEGKSLNNSETIAAQYAYAQDNLAMIKRQVTIGQLYSTDKLVIEK